MSSLLRPVVLESCQATIRGRRRSSVYPLNAVPSLFSSTTSTQNDSAVSDDLGVPEHYSKIGSTSSISPLSTAHVSDYFTSTAVPRHNGTMPTSYPLEPPSPAETLVPSGPSSRKASLTNLSSSPNVSSHSNMERLKWRLASGFFAYFLCGWGDGVTGTVLPYFTAEFHLTSMTSSLLFAGSTCGFALGTVLVERVMNVLGRCSSLNTTSLIPYFPWISQRFSKKKCESAVVRYSATQARCLALLAGSIIHAFHFIMIGSKGGFIVTFMAYAVAAFSRALMTASLNVYFASGPPQSLGYSFGLWSFGGVVSPIVCQTIVSTGVPWFHFYFGSLVVSGINSAFLFYTFKPTVQELANERHEAAVESSKTVSPLSSPIEAQAVYPPATTSPNAPSQTNTLRLALSMFYQWAFSMFATIYCGSETTTQGFMVTYLLGTRGANPKTVGYVTSGFWGGITLGRFAWGYFTPSLSFTQRKFVVLGCLVAALVMHLLIWFVNSNIENAFSSSVIGALYGPLFPAILSTANDLLPAEVHMISMTLISAFGSFGSALFPFIAGAISSQKGIHTLTYITVPLGVMLICLWSLFPSRLPTRNNID